MSNKTLFVITGPTAVGKTSVAIDLTRSLNTEIISADSRQIYRGMPIGTAQPTPEEQALAKHHFINCKNLDEYFSAAQFEAEALDLLQHIFASHDHAVVCGGSMLYVDALCHGIDMIPTISAEVRNRVQTEFAEMGLEHMLCRLKALDPQYFDIVDKKNAKRIVHAVEICEQAGTTYTSLRTGVHRQRPFRTVKVMLNLPREVLFDRINRRVDLMMEQGLLDEAKALYHLRHLNSLNTVGYKELFAYFDGTMDLHTACERIKKNTRVYAKKQLTWYSRDTEMTQLAPADAIPFCLSQL